MAQEIFHAEALHELMLIVERLSTQDRGRIVNLVEMLSRAPRNLRAASQQRLRGLLTGERMTHKECVEVLDTVLAGIERELSGRESTAPQEWPGSLAHRAAAGN